MKRYLIIPQAIAFFLVTLVAAPVSMTGAAFAQQAEPASIAIIDTRRLFSESLVSQDIREQLVGFSQNLSRDENRIREELIEEKEQLDRQQSLMAPEAFEDRYGELQQRADELNRRIDLHQKRLNVAQVRANRELQRVLTPIIQKTADRTGATVVLEKGQIVYQRSGLDITTDVIEELDKELPSLEVELPSEADVVEMERQAQQGGIPQQGGVPQQGRR